MKFSGQLKSLGLGAAILVTSVLEASAFALLGPVQPWMQPTNGVIFPGDIGGPMPIGSGYRWNVPVLTYGFDQSFLNYFGSNGVAAVESAIQILNNLPPASQIALTNCPLVSLQVNSEAADLLDLKSQALSYVLEQLGLAQPTRYIYVLDSWNPSFFNYGDQTANIDILGMPIFQETGGVDPGVGYQQFGGWSDSPGYVTYFVAGYNFDASTLEPSCLVNNAVFSGGIFLNDPFGQNFIASYPVDPIGGLHSAVADHFLNAGVFFTGLTQDDVGGLCYLLSTNTILYETILSDVQGIGGASYVNAARRPGVDKISFVPQPCGSEPGMFLPMTNQFTDTYITDGIAVQQRLQRITLHPDFLFSAGYDAFRTGTTNWINNAVLNNNPGGGGPGNIQPPVVIVFPKVGSFFFSPTSGSEDSVQDGTASIGSFDGSTNAPVVYPIPQTGNIPMALRVYLSHSNSASDSQQFEWKPISLAGTIYAFQTSTNLSAWNTLFEITNNGSLSIYQDANANSSARFYRLVPQ